jgi:hypothetical protein
MSDERTKEPSGSTKNTGIDRIPRSHDGREQETRTASEYIPPSVLPIPEDRDGYTHRWIRTSMLGSSDNTNVSRRFREGWEAVDIKDYEELKVQSDINSQFTGNVEVGGLLLCRAPTEMVGKRNAYYEDKAQQQIDAAEQNYMREQDPRMPTLSADNKSRNSFGRR